MLTRGFFAIVLALTFTLPAFAQVPWQFQWKKGQTLDYKIKNVTSVVEVVDNVTNTSSSAIDAVNRWEVGEVDAKGVAKLTMTIVSMRIEQKRAKGDTLLFDSQNPDKSTPEMREQMQKFVGKPMVCVRLDGYGRVIDVIEGKAATFEVDPPFVIIFPAAKAAAGQAWRRQYNVVLDPPYGTGEKFETEQRYECKKIEAGKATVGITTLYKAMPESPRERLPLLQKDVQGELVFDVPGGRLLSVQLNIDKTIENHQGKGSSYHFKSQYSRVLVE